MKKSVVILFLIILVILISNQNFTGNVPKKDIYVNCYDSDNGINSEEAGKVTVSYSDGNIKSFEDSCYLGEYTAFKGKLREFYCSEDNSFGFKYVDCGNGCKDGKCVEENYKKIFGTGDTTKSMNIYFVGAGYDENQIFCEGSCDLNNYNKILENDIYRLLYNEDKTDVYGFGLLTLEPFKSNLDKINIYMLTELFNYDSNDFYGWMNQLIELSLFLLLQKQEDY